MKSIAKQNAIPSAMADKNGGLPTFPIVDALEELSLVASPAQLQRMLEQSQTISALAIKQDMIRRAKAEAQAKVNQMPEVVSLKSMKAELKKINRALEMGTDRMTGSYITLLADFMPGSHLREKLAAIEDAYITKTSHQNLLPEAK